MVCVDFAELVNDIVPLRNIVVAFFDELLLLLVIETLVAAQDLSILVLLQEKGCAKLTRLLQSDSHRLLLAF